eukprot:m.329560 g.329560  ORF g.329560 m.329560 type:complete len:390 (+) comp16038_c0_seq2:2488-3657(+)
MCMCNGQPSFLSTLIVNLDLNSTQVLLERVLLEHCEHSDAHANVLFRCFFIAYFCAAGDAFTMQDQDVFTAVAFAPRFERLLAELCEYQYPGGLGIDQEEPPMHQLDLTATEFSSATSTYQELLKQYPRVTHWFIRVYNQHASLGPVKQTDGRPCSPSLEGEGDDGDNGDGFQTPPSTPPRQIVDGPAPPTSRVFSPSMPSPLGHQRYMSPQKRLTHSTSIQNSPTKVLRKLQQSALKRRAMAMATGSAWQSSSSTASPIRTIGTRQPQSPTTPLARHSLLAQHTSPGQTMHESEPASPCKHAQAEAESKRSPCPAFLPCAQMNACGRSALCPYSPVQSPGYSPCCSSNTSFAQCSSSLGDAATDVQELISDLSSMSLSASPTTTSKSK